LNKTLAKSAATPAKKVPAKVAPTKPEVAPPPAKASLKPAPAAATKPASRSKAHAMPEPAPAPITNRFTDRFAPARAPVRGHDEPLDVYKPLAKPDPKLANAWKTKSARDLSEAELLAMPDSEYMNEKQREFFRLRLQAQKDDLLSNAGETTEHLREDTSIVPDPADRATIEEEHALELRTRDRERKLLKKIGQSLARVESGDYGYCDETGEPIGLARLLARPTATLSLEAQQRREMKQKMFGD
jgi:DnaK suppressor protein